MKTRANLVKISDHITLIDDAGCGTCYVVEGERRAAVIDTANGLEDLRGIVAGITRLPLTVIATHAHPDHVGGCKYFDGVLMHPADFDAYNALTRRPDVLARARSEGLCFGAPSPVTEGEVIDLGGRTLEVIACPGHTPGSIALLSREDRILFTGDTVLERMIWLQLDGCLKMSAYLASLRHLSEHRARFDTLLTGHGIGPDSPELIGLLTDAAQAVLNGKTDRAGTFVWHGGEDLCYYYKPGSPLVYKPSSL